MLAGIGEKIVIGVSSAVLTTAILLGFSKAGVFVETLLVPDLPGNAVVAFDGQCPEGWSNFDQAAGKFVLGVGQGELRNSGPHSQAPQGTDTPLTRVRLRDEGGAETHTLTEPEMPEHYHEIDRKKGYNFLTQNTVDQANRDNIDLTLENVTDLRVQNIPVTEKKGGNIPHNNMPPYIALYFCKKEAG